MQAANGRGQPHAERAMRAERVGWMRLLGCLYPVGLDEMVIHNLFHYARQRV